MQCTMVKIMSDECRCTIYTKLHHRQTRNEQPLYCNTRSDSRRCAIPCQDGGQEKMRAYVAPLYNHMSHNLRAMRVAV